MQILAETDLAAVQVSLPKRETDTYCQSFCYAGNTLSSAGGTATIGFPVSMACGKSGII